MLNFGQHFGERSILLASSKNLHSICTWSGGGGGGSCKGIIIPRIDPLLDRLFLEIQLAGKIDKVHTVLYTCMYYVNQGIYISPSSEFSFCKFKQYTQCQCTCACTCT